MPSLARQSYLVLELADAPLHVPRGDARLVHLAHRVHGYGSFALASASWITLRRRQRCECERCDVDVWCEPVFAHEGVNTRTASWAITVDSQNGHRKSVRNGSETCEDVPMGGFPNNVQFVWGYFHNGQLELDERLRASSSHTTSR